MPSTKRLRPAILRLEQLETRDLPAALAWQTESFDATAVGALPAGWSQWSSGATAFHVTPGLSHSPANALAGTAGLSNIAARAWQTTNQPADVLVSSAVYLDSLIPAQIYARGSRLDTTMPTYYALSITRGLHLELLRVTSGVTTKLGQINSGDYVSGKWVQVTLEADGYGVQAEVYRFDTGKYLTAAGQWQSSPAWALDLAERTIQTGGLVGLGRPASYAGTITFDDFKVALPLATTSTTSTSPTPTGPTPAAPMPSLPRHYSHIRIAELAYTGNPMSALEDQLLRNSVDLVVAAPSYLNHIQSIAPNTPRLIYTNVSNLYRDLLTDWLNYADAKGLSREAAFFHVSQALAFSGNSASSQPVNWFWRAYRGGAQLTDLTSQARGTQPGGLAFAAPGEALYLAYPERFREININLQSAAANGWTSSIEYVTQVDSAGRPLAWAPLLTLSNTTANFTRSGQITFDPPANWQTASLGGSSRLYYLRFRTTQAGTAPVANTILGRDYVNAGGTTRGVIPAFDYAADSNHDGYLNNAEYARRASGKDARFVYESRAFYGSYGQMRFAVNPSSAAFRGWAADYSLRFLNSQTGATGLFLDNSTGKPPVAAASVLESTARYAVDYGAMLNAINKAISPRWVLANTAGGWTAADEVVRQTTAYYEEFAIRPLAASYKQFEDLSYLIAHRAGLRSSAPYAILDSLPTGGSPTDPRTQIATLAYYYLLADPVTTFLDLYGGYEPASSWARHWSPAVAYDIGQPLGSWSVFATGADPGNAALTYRIYQRSYSNALVLYKPLSAAGTSRGTLADNTVTTHLLNGTYRLLRADGTLSGPINTITLRNGEGAILIK